jgi:hypothetical protein
MIPDPQGEGRILVRGEFGEGVTVNAAPDELADLVALVTLP